MTYFKDRSRRAPQSPLKKWLPVLALVLMIGFFTSDKWGNTDNSKEAIVATYFIAPPGAGFQLEAPNEDAETDSTYLEKQYLLAAQQYRNNEITKAEKTYETVLTNQNNTLYATQNIDFKAAQWNSILMQILQGERREAMEELDKIINSNFPEDYRNNALVLKNKLNSFGYGWANPS